MTVNKKDRTGIGAGRGGGGGGSYLQEGLDNQSDQ